MTNPGDRRPAGPATEIVVFDGFDDLDAIAPLEVLTAAGFPVSLVRPAWQPDMVTSAHGLRLEVQATLGDSAELLLVPGGGWRDGSSVGVRAQSQTALPALLSSGPRPRRGDPPRSAPGRCLGWRPPACSLLAAR